MKLRLAVFDMVGTTIRAGDEVPASFRQALMSVGVGVSNEDLSKVRGRSKREAISELLARGASGERDEARVESVYVRFQEELRSAYRAQVQPIPGAEEVLRDLLDHVEVVLITGLDQETADLVLQGLGWDSLRLTGLVTGDGVTRGRPAPDLILAAMEVAGVEDARSVAVIGDTVSDLEAAAAAGAGWSVGVLSGAHTRPDLEACPHSVILDSVATLPSWLKELEVL